MTTTQEMKARDLIVSELMEHGFLHKKALAWALIIQIRAQKHECPEAKELWRHYMNTAAWENSKSYRRIA